MSTSESLRRQLLQRLEGLRQSGVEFAPRAGSPPPRNAVVSPVDEATRSDSAARAEPRDERRVALSLLAADVAKCTRCGELASTRTQTVFGVGPFDPELCFVGEAPGADEDRQGEPFVGAAGQLLNRIIVAMGLKREEVYICNILRCRPPGNRTPKPDEADNCRGFLEAQLGLIRPKFLCALGLTAAQNLLGIRLTLGRMRGQFFNYKDIPVMVTYHPSFLLPHRSPEKKKDVWEDMKTLLTRMGRSIPGQK